MDDLTLTAKRKQTPFEPTRKQNTKNIKSQQIDLNN